MAFGNDRREPSRRKPSRTTRSQNEPLRISRFSRISRESKFSQPLLFNTLRLVLRLPIERRHAPTGYTRGERSSREEHAEELPCGAENRTAKPASIHQDEANAAAKRSVCHGACGQYFGSHAGVRRNAGWRSFLNSVFCFFQEKADAQDSEILEQASGLCAERPNGRRTHS